MTTINKKIRAVIVEDEEPARMLLKSFLSSFEQIELVAEYADGFSAVKGMDEHKPDLLFLDIQMPKLTGFEVLELAEHKPVVIFTTAFDEYALKAFEVNALDYLLKPFSRERFSASVEKAIDKINKQEPQKLASLIETVDEKKEVLERIAVKSGTKIHIIPAEQVVYIEAEGDYVKINTRDSFYLKEKTMKYFEEHLDKNSFVRIHRSYIVNVTEIARVEYYDKETHIVFLKSGVKLRASTAGYRLLKDVLKI
jgi:two-component system, LytTR family, response regulator